MKSLERIKEMANVGSSVLVAVKDGYDISHDVLSALNQLAGMIERSKEVKDGKEWATAYPYQIAEFILEGKRTK